MTIAIILVTIVLVTFKLAGVIYWSWWLVFFPAIVGAAVFAVFAGLALSYYNVGPFRRRRPKHIETPNERNNVSDDAVSSTDRSKT